MQKTTHFWWELFYTTRITHSWYYFIKHAVFFSHENSSWKVVFPMEIAWAETSINLQSTGRCIYYLTLTVDPRRYNQRTKKPFIWVSDEQSVIIAIPIESQDQLCLEPLSVRVHIAATLKENVKPMWITQFWFEQFLVY